MKKFLLLLVTSILAQGCFTFKEIQNVPSQYETGKYYRLEQENKRRVVYVYTKTDSTLSVSAKKFEKQDISLNSITKVEKRKFSFWKTLLIPVAVYAAAIAGLLIFLSL